MKKILAIAISLVMVFAVAASAFALFGFQANTTPQLVDNIVVDVLLYDLGSTGAANSMVAGWYPNHAPTSGVRNGETYAYAVKLSIPATNSLTSVGAALVAPATTTNGLTISTSNLTSSAPVHAYTDGTREFSQAFGGTQFDAFANNECMIDNGELDTFGALSATAATTYIFYAECTINTLADATVSAVYGAPDPTMGAATTDTTCMIGNWGVYAANGLYTMEEYNSAGALNNNEVNFVVGAADNAGNMPILSTYVNDGNADYLVSQNPTSGAIQFHDAATNAPVADANTYTVLNGILTRAMSAMGFTWTPGGVLYDEGFEALAARGLQFSDSETFYAYTAALTVAGTATVPDTGDTTVVGIVMMAVAVLATAAIVIKKVRA